MTIMEHEMTTQAISVSKFKAHCLDVIRHVETDGASVDLVRHGRVVARLVPTTSAASGVPAWLRLRHHGALSAAPDESVLDAGDFMANRDTPR